MMKRLILTILGMALMVAYSYYHTAHNAEAKHSYQQDFRIYVDAAEGNFRPEFYYPRFTAKLWYLATLMPFDTAFVINAVLTIIATVFIFLKVYRLPMGWLFLILGTKYFLWGVYVGNVYPILIAITLVSPLLALACAVIKLQFLAVIFLLSINRSFELRRERLYTN